MTTIVKEKVIMPKMTHTKFKSMKTVLLSDCTDEQLRFFRIACASELEKRLEKQESKYFKRKAIGA